MLRSSVRWLFLVLGVLALPAVAAAAPNISSLSPTSGMHGTVVTIIGTGFGSTQGTSTVKFNTTTVVTINSWSSTSIQAVVPNGATDGNVVVRVGGVNSNGKPFDVLTANISTLTPSSGPVGITVTIAGTNFGASQGASTVKFNGTLATVTTWGAESIVAVVPAGATTGSVIVNVGGVNSNSKTFTVGLPNISSLTPTAGLTGTAVTITGTRFGATQESGTVKFGGITAAVSSWSATSIVATVPASAPLGNVGVIVHAGVSDSNTKTFKIVAAPVITSLNPAYAVVDTPIEINGNDFSNFGTVTFNGTPATTIWSWASTHATVLVPAGATTGPVILTTEDNISSNGVTFTIPPVLTSLTPATAHLSDAVVIAGSGFLASQGSNTVKFNGTTASPTSWSDTSITVPVPAGATSGNVVVAINGVASNGLAFTVILPPAIATLTPSSAHISDTIVIAGSNFGASQGTSTLTFNGTAATPATWSDTSITAPVPAGTTTGPVVVTVSNQASPGATFTLIVPGSLGGSITRVTGGTAIVGATVQAVLAGVVKASVTSAGDGSYSIPSVDPGTYDVRVFKSGFSPELRTGNVVVSATTTTVNVAMFEPGSVTGKVTQVDGVTPLVGAAVTAYDGPFQKGNTNTNAAGEYTIANLHPGTFTIQAANVGYRTAEQAAAIAENAATTKNFSLETSPAGPVLYAYDELGRLVQVTDPSGESAIYRYDAVGNIASIERPGAGVISISDFTPNGGPIGTPVTIYGAGFSTTPASNVVKFNGVEATVTSATPTQIVTTVPASATDGSITVTVSTTTGTSPSPFDVKTPTAPTVMSFTPTIAAAGSAVTINGTNFDTVPINDKLRLNISPSQVESATTTAIQTTVPPSATTGKVSVTTPNGAGVSADYLWIAPPPYTVAQLEAPVPAAFDTEIDVSAGIDKIVLLAFEGVEGHRVAIDATNINGIAEVKLYTPFGALIKSLIAVSSGFFDTEVLRWTGTYSIVFDPMSQAAVTGKLRIYDVPADIAGPIAFATPLVVTTTGPGQNGRLTFTGTAGHRLSLDQADYNCFTSSTSILKPDGTSLATTCGGTFLGPTAVLTATGTYTVLVDPKGAVTGSTTVTLYDVPADVTGSLNINDPATPVSLAIPGQNAIFSFSGTSAQQVTVHLTNSTILGTLPCVTVSLVRQDGTTTLTQNSSCGASFDLSTQTLPATETYTVRIDPIANSAGSISVRVSSQ